MTPLDLQTAIIETYSMMGVAKRCDDPANWTKLQSHLDFLIILQQKLAIELDQNQFKVRYPDPATINRTPESYYRYYGPDCVIPTQGYKPGSSGWCVIKNGHLQLGVYSNEQSAIAELTGKA